MAKVIVKMKVIQSIPRWGGLRRLKYKQKFSALLDEVGERVAAEAGEGFEWKRAPDEPGRYDPRGIVKATDIKSARRNSRDHVLLRAIVKEHDANQ